MKSLGRRSCTSGRTLVTGLTDLYRRVYQNYDDGALSSKEILTVRALCHSGEQDYKTTIYNLQDRVFRCNWTSKIADTHCRYESQQGDDFFILFPEGKCSQDYDDCKKSKTWKFSRNSRLTLHGKKEHQRTPVI